VFSSVSPHVVHARTRTRTRTRTHGTEPQLVGAGAVGCFYASRMHKEPHILVSLVCRSNYTAIKANGVTLKTHNFGDYHFYPEYVFNSVQVAAGTKLHWDYVVVTAKALPDISDDSLLVAPVVDRDSTIVLIQNGVGVEEPYRRRFTSNPVLSAVTVVSAEQVEQGVIRQNRWTRISTGPYTHGLWNPDSEATKLGEAKTAEFVKLLQDGGIKDAEIYDERGLQFVRWHKIAVGTLNLQVAFFHSGPL
jgi:2-dehydropantoate 2-reductase